MDLEICSSSTRRGDIDIGHTLLERTPPDIHWFGIYAVTEVGVVLILTWMERIHCEVHESLVVHPKPVNVFIITVICVIKWRTICHQMSTFPAPAVLATLALAGLRTGTGAGQDLCSGMTTLGPSGGEYLQAGVVPMRRRQLPTTAWCSSTIAEQGEELTSPTHFWNWPRVTLKYGGKRIVYMLVCVWLFSPPDHRIWRSQPCTILHSLCTGLSSPQGSSRS